MLFSKKKTTGSAVSKKGKKCYKIKYVYETDSDLENSVEIDSENDEVESPEEVIETKRGKHKIPLDKDKDVKEPVRKSHKKHVDSSDKSDKSEDKSDETGTNDMENVNTSKETVSVETVSKPAAQPSMTLPMHGSQQSLVGLQSYQNMMPGMQPQMMSPYGIQPLAAAW